MTTSGAFVRELATPALFNPGAGTGVRNNLAFESLALTPGGHTVYAATEMALIQDGPQTGEPGVTSVTRVQSYDRASGRPLAQYAYVVDPIAVTTPSPRPFENNGLVEMPAIGERQFLTVERSFTLPASYTIRLFLTEIAEDTTDVPSLPSLVGATYTPMRKTLLLDLSDTAVVADDLGLLPSASRIRPASASSWTISRPSRWGRPSTASLPSSWWPTTTSPPASSPSCWPSPSPPRSAGSRPASPGPGGPGTTRCHSNLAAPGRYRQELRSRPSRPECIPQASDGARQTD